MVRTTFRDKRPLPIHTDSAMVSMISSGHGADEGERMSIPEPLVRNSQGDCPGSFRVDPVSPDSNEQSMRVSMCLDTPRPVPLVLPTMKKKDVDSINEISVSRGVVVTIFMDGT